MWTECHAVSHVFAFSALRLGLLLASPLCVHDYRRCMEYPPSRWRQCSRNSPHTFLSTPLETSSDKVLSVWCGRWCWQSSGTIAPQARRRFSPCLTTAPPVCLHVLGKQHCHQVPVCRVDGCEAWLVHAHKDTVFSLLSVLLSSQEHRRRLLPALLQKLLSKEPRIHVKQMLAIS